NTVRIVGRHHPPGGVSPMKPRRCGFTVLEVLAVSGIVAVLAGLLAHTVRKMEAAADQTNCTNNLKLVLESWKRGEQPTALLESSSGITVRDTDWEGSKRLLDYRIQDCRREGAGLRFSVQLRLRDESRRAIAKQATYWVFSNPDVRVAREPLP